MKYLHENLQFFFCFQRTETQKKKKVEMQIILRKYFNNVVSFIDEKK